MSKVIYIIFYLISLLPLWVLHGIGDIIWGILLLVGYRKEVVMQNLKTAFPEKSNTELKKISRKFYRNFVHTFMETIKFVSISERQLSKMITADFSIPNELLKKHPRLTWLSGHFMNWELYAIYPPKFVNATVLAVYMSISNKAFDDLFYKIRSRFGTILLKAGEMKTAMIPWRNKEYIIGLGADQNPPNPLNAVWLNFFGKPTPFVTGPEKNARMGNTPVLISWMEKKGIGKYQVKVELICEDPSTMPPNAIQKKYVQLLEEKIKLHPDNYLWTHKRWRHIWKPEYKSIWIDDAAAPE